MPTYNSESVLSNAVESVIRQSIGFENIELILVDDKSTDNTRKIISSYVDKYSNIIPVFLNENHGVPSIGRNIGIDVATSEFIMFIDHDDEFDLEICEKLYVNILENDVDLVTCDGLKIDSNTKNIKATGDVEKIFLEPDNIYKFNSNLVVWNKIFKKSIINKFNIRFPPSRHEDFYFSYKYIIHSKSMLYLKNYYGYKWIIQDTHLGDKVTYSQALDLIKMYCGLYDEIIQEKINPYFYFDEKFQSNSILLLSSSDIINKSKSELCQLFEYCILFEKKIKFDLNLNILADIGKKLILTRKFSLAIIYFKFLSVFRGNKFITLIFNKLFYGYD